MTTKMKKLLALVLALCMILSQMSMMAFAEGEEGGTTIETDRKMVNGDKTATDLDENFNSDVTLKIPGEVEQLGVDIIYIMGAFIAASEVETDLMINSLYDTFVEIVSAGTPVNFGVVPFSSDNKAVMELTTFATVEELETLPDKLAEAIEKAAIAYGGENMENALQTAKRMFSESPLAEHPERQHLVMVSTGHTYNFNSGEKNNLFSTVPVAINDSKGLNKLFYGFKAWMQARNANPNTYPIPKAFTKYMDSRDWDAYWEQIEIWAAADVEAEKSGERNLVYVIRDTTDDSFTYNNWYTTDYLNQDASGSKYGSMGLYIHTAVDPNFKFEDAVEVKAGSLGTSLDKIDDSAKHAISYERAMWEAYNFINDEITGSGINFYPIYQAMKPQYSNGIWSNNTVNPDGSKWNYGVTWTNQYIGHSFMNMLAGGEAVNYSEATDKTFFDPIKAEILYCVSAGSTVTDYIGYDADEKEGYNFDFVLGAENLKLTVGDKVYSVAEVESAEGVTATYEFTAPDGETATFKLEYYYGTGTDDEYFIWTLNENISKYRQVALTYKVNLKEKSAVVGKHTANTNIDAYLEPVDSEGNKGEKEYFPEPTVEYKNVYTVTVNYYDQESGEVISESFTTEGNENGTYDVTEKDAIEIGGYTYVFTDGDDLTGVLDEDKVINVYYNVEPTTEEPTTEEPTTEEPSTEEPTTEEEETEDFTEEEVPLGPNPDPETGDVSFVWVVALAVSGLTLAALPILKKSGKNE